MKCLARADGKECILDEGNHPEHLNRTFNGPGSLEPYTDEWWPNEEYQDTSAPGGIDIVAAKRRIRLDPRVGKIDISALSTKR